MIQGTGSGVGKTIIVAGLCRIFKRKGYCVAPFKAQNMSLNSAVAVEGGEISTAQALQARSAGIEPSIYMNPILLKATSEMGSQVILLGKPIGNMKPKEYYNFKEKAWQAVVTAWQHLSSYYDLIIIEGAGSPAEVNLMDKEIVNMAIAKYTNSPVILVGDIDRGGVFASIYGTVALLDNDAKYIKGFIINKFRGDINILIPGNKIIEKRTGKPVIGIIPYMSDIKLDEEDSLNIPQTTFVKKNFIIIAIIRLPYISNFNDFSPFLYEPDVELTYTVRSEDILNSDLIILPGTKNTIKDLIYLKQTGIEDTLKQAFKKGIPIIGICGGYQMLGKIIKDPYKVESDIKEIKGIGLLDIETVFMSEKITSLLRAKLNDNFIEGIHNSLKGYEIHMGETTGDIGIFTIERLSMNHQRFVKDGSRNSNVWGTYIHGLFENDSFRTALINYLRQRKNLPPRNLMIEYNKMKEYTFDKLADFIQKYLDIDFLEHIIFK